MAKKERKSSIIVFKTRVIKTVSTLTIKNWLNNILEIADHKLESKKYLKIYFRVSTNVILFSLQCNREIYIPVHGTFSHT